jgi:hypothetical protein
MPRLLPLLLPAALSAAAVPFDASRVQPGPVRVEAAAESVAVLWPDAEGRPWRAEFSLDPAKPLLTSAGPEGKPVVERAQPLYRVNTGKRRGGWDQFFDFPPSHPAGTRAFRGEFRLKAASAVSLGDRVEMIFDGLEMGIFSGSISYTFYPGSTLVQQAASAKTSEPDTAYYYDTGLRMAADADRRPGGNIESSVSYYDTSGQFRTVRPEGPEWNPVAARYRALAAKTANGSVVVFPAPHQYFFPRDFTTNLGYLWHTAWRGAISLGIRQLPDDNSPYYPWVNAPPGTEQRMSVFYLLSARPPREALDEALRFTNRDRFPALDGYKTLTTHWHFAYTVQAMDKGFAWTPPFKPVLQSMGVDAAVIMDFHGDGHPQDLTELRLRELDAFFKACRAQSGPDFLLMPSEEANVHLGGHWALIFPKPVYWFMNRPQGAPYRAEDSKFGPVYRVADSAELLKMVRAEGGYMYQTHPRTKGSTGFPDKIRETEHFRDPRYWGGGWKAMNSDYSTPRLGERSLKLLDDMNNWGLKKKIFGEVDVFQIDETHELYGHMNVNYVRAGKLPDWDHYGQLLEAVDRNDFFTTTGEVLLPETSITGSPALIVARAKVRHTFPLKMAEVVWGNGGQTFREIIPLETTRPFSEGQWEWKLKAPEWKWARIAVWDVAANGAFTNPVWR